MARGSYRGHHFGRPAYLKIIDDMSIALSHPDPGMITWSLAVNVAERILRGELPVRELSP